MRSAKDVVQEALEEEGYEVSRSSHLCLGLDQLVVIDIEKATQFYILLSEEEEAG